MSSDFYITLKAVPYACVFDGRLEKSGVYEHVDGQSSEVWRCLTDRRNYLWLSASDDGLLEGITCHKYNVPIPILTAIAETFDAEIFPEYGPRFWGFDTQEAVDAYREEITQKSRKVLR